MNKIKYITCVSVHCLLLWLGMSYYQQYREKDLIVRTTSSIEVYILDIHYRAKSPNTCDVVYKGREYKNIIFYSNKIIKSTFNNNFYYHKDKDWIFCKGNEQVLAIVDFILLGLSFLLWFIPVERFSLNW